MACIGDERFSTTAYYDEDGFQIQIDEEKINLECNWSLGEPVMRALISGEEVTIQYEGRKGQILQLRHYGNQVQ